jgi:hypothetical protein
VRCHAPQVLRSKTSAVNGIANGRAFRAARPLIVPRQKPCGGTQDLLAWFGNTNFRERQILVAQRGTSGRHHISASRRLERRLAAPGNRKLLGQFRDWASPEMLMRKRRDSAEEAGVRSGRASDLRDTRQGTYGPAGDQTQEDLSDPTPRKRAQSGGAMQGDHVPANNFQLPEGIKRQPMGAL